MTEFRYYMGRHLIEIIKKGRKKALIRRICKDIIKHKEKSE